MSDKTRKKFNASNQQVEDLIKGIRVCKPIISLIKECGEKEREALNLQVQLVLDEGSLKQLSAVSTLLRNNGITESLEQKRLQENIQARFNQLKEKEEELDKEIKELQEEINEYIFYIEKSFIWIAEDILQEIVPKCIPLCDEDEFLVLLFILFNREFAEIERQDNEELVLDSLKRKSNRSKMIMKVNHNLDNLIIYIKQN